MSDDWEQLLGRAKSRERNLKKKLVELRKDVLDIHETLRTCCTCGSYGCPDTGVFTKALVDLYKLGEK